MKKISKEEALIYVKEEIDRIKNEAPKDQIERLNWETFDGNWGDHCIYGQMSLYTDTSYGQVMCPSIYDYMYVVFKADEYYNRGVWTILECYVKNLKGEQARPIIDYIKGVTNELIL